MAIQISLTAQEAAELRRIVESERQETSAELRRTRERDFRDQVEWRLRFVERLERDIDQELRRSQAA